MSQEFGEATKKRVEASGNRREAGVQVWEIWPEPFLTIDTLSLSLHVLFKKAPSGEQGRIGQALFLEG